MLRVVIVEPEQSYGFPAAIEQLMESLRTGKMAKPDELMIPKSQTSQFVDC